MFKLWEDDIHKDISVMSKILYFNDFDAMSYEELKLPMNISKSWTMLNQCQEVMMMLNLFCDVKDRPLFTSGASSLCSFNSI